MRLSIRAFTILLLLLPILAVAEEARSCSVNLEKCVVEKRAQYVDRGVLGFNWAPAVEGEPVPTGSFVVRGAPAGYPAHAAGLKGGDLLISILGKPVAGASREQVERWIESIKVGQEVVLEVLRDGERRLLTIKAGAPDSRSVEAWVGLHVLREHGREAYERYHRELRPRPPKPAGSP